MQCHDARSLPRYVIQYDLSQNATLHGPYARRAISSTGDEIPINEAQLLGRANVPVDRQPRVRMRRPVVHLDPVLARARNDLAAVKLQSRDRELVLVRFNDAAGTDVPYLQSESLPRNEQCTPTNPDGLVQTARDNVVLIELKAGDRGGMPCQRAVRLARSH